MAQTSPIGGKWPVPATQHNSMRIYANGSPKLSVPGITAVDRSFPTFDT